MLPEVRTVWIGSGQDIQERTNINLSTVKTFLALSILTVSDYIYCTHVFRHKMWILLFVTVQRSREK